MQFLYLYKNVDRDSYQLNGYRGIPQITHNGGGVEREGGRERALGLWDPGSLLTTACIHSPLTRGGVGSALLLSLTAYARLLQS